MYTIQCNSALKNKPRDVFKHEWTLTTLNDIYKPTINKRVLHNPTDKSYLRGKAIETKALGWKKR